MTDRYHFRPAERRLPGSLLRPLQSALAHHRPCYMWQAERFDWVVGVIAWQREPRSITTATVAVNVDPSCRGQGVGRFLLEQAMHAARETGLRTLLARVSRENAAAMHLFTKSGFQPLLEASVNEPGDAAVWLGKSLLC
ncbi:GNAT family N-acetyltransferase [Permianibacter sp. IMCC34836]|uniref:GNAT family N-acetyltransferase n=1 Tax=Permianibacter fluminis TaxID=2738515 RepID=UPI0015545FB0|nr:GNAT family N-acetyltransferase [Permianibacter fluminis]NQD36177.1 GNAT family N-acetyltransferase [Permianibacter fluminis]